MRILILILMTGTLFLAGCQGESQDPSSSDAASSEIGLEDDLSEVYDETMDRASEAQAGIEEMLDRDPAELTGAAVGKVWERARELADRARVEAEQAIEAAGDGGGEAWEDARYAAEQARERSNLAWEQAREFSGEAWEAAQAETAEARERAEAMWEQLSEVEVTDSDDDNDGSGG